jgi:hypothetical protein
VVFAACLTRAVTCLASKEIPAFTKLSGVEHGTPNAMMLETRLASAWTGQNHDRQEAVCRIVAPRSLFFFILHKERDRMCTSQVSKRCNVRNDGVILSSESNVLDSKRDRASCLFFLWYTRRLATGRRTPL